VPDAGNVAGGPKVPQLTSLPASQFSLADLAAIYNETRADYIVPMPMSPARLAEYMAVYDVYAAASSVIVEDDVPVGLGMLGVRPGQAWITRLGVSPKRRRAGAGRLLMEQLVAQAEARNVGAVWLEVIKGNAPAHRLFSEFGFRTTRELLVVRRSPVTERAAIGSAAAEIESVVSLTRDQALALLDKRQERPNWLNETASMRNADQLEAVLVRCRGGGEGWASFDVGKFLLTRVVVEVLQGEPARIAAAILQAVHQRYPRKDTFIENVAADDPKWPGFQRVGYFDAFRRIEMVKRLDD
jgi:ribosomal protein S18 acetylase RimI-like enzyme